MMTPELSGRQCEVTGLPYGKISVRYPDGKTIWVETEPDDDGSRSSILSMLFLGTIDND